MSLTMIIYRFYFNSTVEHVGGTQARPNVDYIAVTNSSIVIPSGNDSANINITIPDDIQPELGEIFDVVLEHVELVGQPSPVLPPQLGGIKRVAVTILMSDDAHGLIVIRAPTSDQGTEGSRLTVNETENLPIRLVIERLKGNDGPFLQYCCCLCCRFFAQMFDLSQLLVRFYNRETLLRLMEHEQYFAFLVLSVPFLGNGKGAEVFIRGERAHRRSAFVRKGGNLISVFFLCVTHIFFIFRHHRPGYCQS